MASFNEPKMQGDLEGRYRDVGHSLFDKMNVTQERLSAMKNDAEESLRNEIIESEKSQADFLKWKLISIAAVSSASFGFTTTGAVPSEGARLLICLIPLICAYVDLISLHLMIRIVTIGVYLRLSGNAYERFAFKLRDLSRANPFVFEAIALHGSSFVFAVIILALGFTIPQNETWPRNILTAYIVAGLLGIGVTVFSWVMYTMRAREVVNEAEVAFKASNPDMSK